MLKTIKFNFKIKSQPKVVKQKPKVVAKKVVPKKSVKERIKKIVPSVTPSFSPSFTPSVTPSKKRRQLKEKVKPLISLVKAEPRNLAKHITEIVAKSGITVPRTAENANRIRKESVVPRGYGGAVPNYHKVLFEVEEKMKDLTTDRSIFFDIVASEIAYKQYNEMVWKREWVRYCYTILVRLHVSKKKQAAKILELEHTKGEMLRDYMAHFIDKAGDALRGFNKTEIKIVALKSLHTANNIASFDRKRPHKTIWAHCMIGNLAELKFAKDTNQNIDAHTFDGARFYDFEFGGVQWEVKYINADKLKMDMVNINRTSSGYSKIEREKWDYLVIYTNTSKGLKYYGYIEKKAYKKQAQVRNGSEVIIDKKYIKHDNIVRAVCS